jgi:hypothetical protein
MRRRSRNEGASEVENSQPQPPLVISPDDLGQAESKPQPAAPEPFAGAPSPPQIGTHRPNSLGAVLWIVVPAVAAAMTAFGFLMCGGVFFLFLIGSSSDTSSSPEPYAVYSDPAYTYSGDPYAAPTDYAPTDYAYKPETPYEPTAYVAPPVIEPNFTDPTYVEPAYVEPAYVQPTYVEPVYVEPAYVDSSASGESQFWSFADPESELASSIKADEEELVKFDVAIVAARGGQLAGEIEAQDGETAADQLFGLVFAVGSETVEQQLLVERAAVQARLDANRAELARLRGQ